MGITMTGCLLRQERLRQNLSLEGVAGGACTAVHLSKIKNGLAQPSPEMVCRLFASLKIDFIQDTALLREPAEAMEQYFDAILHNDVSRCTGNSGGGRGISAGLFTNSSVFFMIAMV